MKNFGAFFKMKNVAVFGLLIVLQMGLSGCILETYPSKNWTFDSCDDEVDFKITTAPVAYKYSWKLYYWEDDAWTLVNAAENQSNSYSASICPDQIAKLTVTAHHTLPLDDYYEWSINGE